MGYLALLQSIGFDARYVSCRVCHSPDQLGPEFDHMAIVVLFMKKYLVDVGFGEFTLHPLEMTPNHRSTTLSPPSVCNRKVREYGLFTNFERSGFRSISFTTQKRCLADFEAMSDFHQTSSDSHFTKGRLSQNGLRMAVLLSPIANSSGLLVVIRKLPRLTKLSSIHFCFNTSERLSCPCRKNECSIR